MKDNELRELLANIERKIETVTLIDDDLKEIFSRIDAKLVEMNCKVKEKLRKEQMTPSIFTIVCFAIGAVIFTIIMGVILK